jgi:hypothetical protein
MASTPFMDRLVVELRELVAAGCPVAFMEDRLIGRSRDDAVLYQHAAREFSETIGWAPYRREVNGLREHLRRAVEAGR